MSPIFLRWIFFAKFFFQENAYTSFILQSCGSHVKDIKFYKIRNLYVQGDNWKNFDKSTPTGLPTCLFALYQMVVFLWKVIYAVSFSERKNEHIMEEFIKNICYSACHFQLSASLLVSNMSQRKPFLKIMKKLEIIILKSWHLP